MLLNLLPQDFERMTATNHALTGAIIGLTISQPVPAMILALLSHFVLDAIPHFKLDKPDDELLKSTWFRNYLVVEAVVCFALVVLLFTASPNNWFIPAFCAFLAASPDLLSINKYLKTRRGLKHKPNLYTQFASGIQWFQRPIGVVVEVAWFAGAVVILANIL